MDILIGRNGDSLSGKVAHRSFTIRTRLGPLEVQTRRIRWIHFCNPPEFPLDELWLEGGDRLTGTLSGSAITFRERGGSVLHISHESIHTIVVNPTLDTKIKR